MDPLNISASQLFDKAVEQTHQHAVALQTVFTMMVVVVAVVKCLTMAYASSMFRDFVLGLMSATTYVTLVTSVLIFATLSTTAYVEAIICFVVLLLTALAYMIVKIILLARTGSWKALMPATWCVAKMPGGSISYSAVPHILTFMQRNHQCEAAGQIINTSFSKLPDKIVLKTPFSTVTFSVIAAAKLEDDGIETNIQNYTRSSIVRVSVPMSAQKKQSQMGNQYKPLMA